MFTLSWKVKLLFKIKQWPQKAYVVELSRQINSSYAQVSKHLEYFKEAGLAEKIEIKYKGMRRRYYWKLTPKGEEVLGLLVKVEELSYG